MGKEKAIEAEKEREKGEGEGGKERGENKVIYCT